MKLSIITVCYNQLDIEDTCKSIVNQTFQDFEWIVIDGGSTDSTLEKFGKYKDRINVLIFERDHGIYNAMNKGIKLAHGEWINFMNGGDSFSDDNILQEVFDCEKNESDIMYGYMNLELFDKELLLHTYPEKIDRNYLLNHCINHQSSFIKKSLFDKYGPYSEDYKYVSDWEKWLCFMHNGCKFQLIPKVVAKFKNNGSTYCCSKENNQKNIKDRTAIVKKYYKYSELENLLPYDKSRVKLFNFIPFIKEYKYLNKTKIYVFGIPLITKYFF